MNELTIQINHIFKSYKQVRALKDFTCTFHQGVYALLGPNGSGKSTLMSILTQNLKQDSGEIFFNGENIRHMGKRYREQIGFMPQTAGLFSSFTLYDFLMYMANLKGLDRHTGCSQINNLIEQVELAEYKNRKIGTFSGGMKQRALLAQALLGNPTLLILDEPTAGLDPMQRMNMKNMLMQYAKSKCILIATHIVPDIDDLATNLIFLKKGAIVAQGDTDALRGSLTNLFWELSVHPDSQDDVKNSYRVVKFFQKNNQIFARVFSETRPCEQAIAVSAEIEDCYYYHLGEMGDNL